jgi:hypothetical protein
VILWSVASGQQVRTLSGHTQIVWDVAFSPDGQRLVSAGGDQTARVWDVNTGRELVCFRGHRQPVGQAKFSPDGRRIASASNDQTVKVWDPDTGDVIHTLRGHAGPTSSVAFSRDGRRIASGSYDGTIKIWDAAGGEELLTLRGHENEIFSVVFGPEDQWLASSGLTDQTIRLWEATPLTPERRLRREAAALVNDLPTALGFKDEILAYLRTLPALSEPLRQHALTMAERLPEDPWRLNRASFQIVRQSGLDAARYRLALRQAEAARDLGHPGFVFAPDYHATTHIGMAHYRLGEYREAVEALTASEAYYAADRYFGNRYKTGTPWNLAFLVMAHQQLGEKENAGALLARLYTLMKDPAWASREDLHRYLCEAEEVCVSGAPPLAEEERRLRRKAADLVAGLPSTLGFKDEILDYLRTLPALSEPLREHALTIAERLPEDPWRLNRASYQVAQLRGLDAAKYRLALRHAEAARDLAPPKFDFKGLYPPTTHVGMARYRLGEYREAVEALTASEAYHAAASPRYKAGTPWNLAFLVMAHHRMGEGEKAQAIMARLHELMKDPARASRGDLQGYLREAEELLIVWGGPPPTEEERELRREAAARVDDLPIELGFKDEIRAYLCALPALSEPLREHALTIAERLPEDPWRLNRASYQVVRQSGLDVATYQLALRQAEAAQQLGPPSYRFFLPIYHPAAVAGMAHYRLGHYREGVETLLRADAIYKEQAKRGNLPHILAFLAMAYYQLDQKEEAQSTLARLREVMKDPVLASQGDLQRYVRETEELIAGKAPDPQE